MTSFSPRRFGWHRDSPDPRDYSPFDERVRGWLDRLEGGRPVRGRNPARVDWRAFLPRPKASEDRASCTALACVTLAAYFECRATGRRLDASPMFLYQMARRLLHWKDDIGAKLRPTLKAMVRFGLPPEALCEDSPGAFDAPLDPHLFCYRDECAAIRYVRLDPTDLSGPQTLTLVKSHLAAGFPCALGLTVFDSLTREPDIPAPTIHDRPCGGVAVVAVGYDDARRYRSSKGALLVRGPWGEEWGEHGSGWLPYSYVEKQLAADFWTLVKPAWLESGEFTRPRVV